MAQAKVIEVEAMEAETVGDTVGESVNLSAVFQARQSVRVKLTNGIEAIRLATINAGDAVDAIEETANAPLVLAAQAIAGGLIGKDELSESLCEAFGRGPDTKAGKESKTPIGYGLTFRKRAVCLSQAIGIANGEVKEDDYPKWTEGKDKAFIAETVEAMLAGETSASVAYRDLTEKERAPKPPLAFDAARLTKLAETLNDAASREKIAASPALVAAYQAIVAAWQAGEAEIAF